MDVIRGVRAGTSEIVWANARLKGLYELRCTRTLESKTRRKDS